MDETQPTTQRGAVCGPGVASGPETPGVPWLSAEADVSYDHVACPDGLRCRACGHPVEPRMWGGGECDRCGSVSVAIVPTAEELTRFYASFNCDYRGGGRSDDLNLWRYAKRYLGLVRRFATTGRLIDVGCSRSPFPNLAARSGFEVTALDTVRPEGLDANVAFVIGSLDDAALVDRAGMFDVVTSWAVLEHVPDPARAIGVLASLCRPGGLIFVSTPEIGTRLTRCAIGRSGWFCPPKHLHLVSPAAVQSLFAQHGCDMIRWGRFELNAVRYLARYGIGVAEAALGWVVKAGARRRWQRLRDTRLQRFRGICVFVLRKAPPRSTG